MGSEMCIRDSANSPLPTPQDRLLFILTYLKQNAIQEVHGQLFDMSQSNVSKWVRLLLDILNAALASQSLLPARTASELAALLQAETMPVDPEAPPFFARMEPNGQSHDPKTAMSKKSTTAASRKTIRSKM